MLLNGYTCTCIELNHINSEILKYASKWKQNCSAAAQKANNL